MGKIRIKVDGENRDDGGDDERIYVKKEATFVCIHPVENRKSCLRSFLSTSADVTTTRRNINAFGSSLVGVRPAALAS